jgi:hypothetical protein
MFLCTTLGIIYVHQQLSLVKLSYDIEENQRLCSALLDQNRILEYNIASLKSPKKVTDILREKEMGLVVPAVCQVVRIEKETENTRIASRADHARGGLLSLFELSRVAVASMVDSRNNIH